MMLLNSYDCNFCKIKPLSGSGRSPGGGNGNPLQYSCLENPMDREAWWATVHGVTKTDMTEQLTLSLVAEHWALGSVGFVAAVR